MIPETKHTVVVVDQPPIADGVAWVRGMLAAIDFNDEAALTADKIDDEPTNRFLANKFVPLDLACAQAIPQSSFCVRLGAPQFTGAFSLCKIRTAHFEGPPHPDR